MKLLHYSCLWSTCSCLQDPELREWAISSNNRKANPADKTHTSRLSQQSFGLSSSFGAAHITSSCWAIHLLSSSLSATRWWLLRLEETHTSQPVQLRDKRFERVLVPFPAQAITGRGVSTPAPKPHNMVMAHGPSSLNSSERLHGCNAACQLKETAWSSPHKPCGERYSWEEKKSAVLSHSSFNFV